MKKAASAFRFWAATVLLAAFLGAFAAREAHRVFGHAAHERAHCGAKEGERHLHDQRFAADGCSLCDFVFWPLETPAALCSVLHRPSSGRSFAGLEKSSICASEPVRIDARGPPDRR